MPSLQKSGTDPQPRKQKTIQFSYAVVQMFCMSWYGINMHKLQVAFIPYFFQASTKFLCKSPGLLKSLATNDKAT